MDSGVMKNAAKFNVTTVKDARLIVKEALESPKGQFLLNKTPPDGTIIENSYVIITDLGRVIGTKGQTKVKTIIGSDGTIWSTYPIK